MSYDTNISHQLFDNIITFVYCTTHEHLFRGDLVPTQKPVFKRSFKDFWHTRILIQIWYDKFN